MTAIVGNTELRSKGTKIETGQNASIERPEKSPRRRGRAPGALSKGEAQCCRGLPTEHSAVSRGTFATGAR